MYAHLFGANLAPRSLAHSSHISKRLETVIWMPHVELHHRRRKRCFIRSIRLSFLAGCLGVQSMRIGLVRLPSLEAVRAGMGSFDFCGLRCINRVSVISQSLVTGLVCTGYDYSYVQRYIGSCCCSQKGHTGFECALFQVPILPSPTITTIDLQRRMLPGCPKTHDKHQDSSA